MENSKLEEDLLKYAKKISEQLESIHNLINACIAGMVTAVVIKLLLRK